MALTRPVRIEAMPLTMAMSPAPMARNMPVIYLDGVSFLLVFLFWLCFGSSAGGGRCWRGNLRKRRRHPFWLWEVVVGYWFVRGSCSIELIVIVYRTSFRKSACDLCSGLVVWLVD